MALQSSGTIKMSEINTELGRSSTATISLDTAENGGYATINTASASYPSATNPASMSEWYGYDHNASSGPSFYNGLISNNASGDPNEACAALVVAQPVFKNGSSSVPTSGDFLFADEQLTSAFRPGAGFGVWYKYEDVDQGNVPYSILLLQGGGGETVIEAVNPC